MAYRADRPGARDGGNARGGSRRIRAACAGLAGREAQRGRPLPVHLVSITLDPDSDTPEVLRGYAESTGADSDRWSFLSGRSQDLDRIVVHGFKTSFERADPSAGIGAIMHGEWLVLVDATGSLRGFYAANDPERMQALVTDAVRLADGVTPATPSPESPRRLLRAVLNRQSSSTMRGLDSTALPPNSTATSSSR